MIPPDPPCGVSAATQRVSTTDAASDAAPTTPPNALRINRSRFQRLVPPQRLRAAAPFKSGRHMRWHIKVLRGCNVCANSFIALRAPRRATRFLPREILTLPRRRLSAPLLHHGPPPATPRPMTYHPRDNATAHGPRPTRQRPTPSDTAPTTQPRQRCRGARAKLTAPPYASAVTRAPSDAAPDEATTNAAQRRHTRPTQQPPHEAPTQRHPQRRSTTRRHTGARAEHQGATQLPHCVPTQRHGARSKAPSRPKHNRSAWLHHDTTDDTPDTPRPDQV